MDSVTILILIDGFLQFKGWVFFVFMYYGHNPYFNRWFSAIKERNKLNNIREGCHNPYFNRWFSAMSSPIMMKSVCHSHNPYFNRWFSAICTPYRC